MEDKRKIKLTVKVEGGKIEREDYPELVARTLVEAVDFEELEAAYIGMFVEWWCKLRGWKSVDFFKAMADVAERVNEELGEF